MNQERPSDVPYSVSDAGCLVFRNGRGVVNFDSRRDAINAASLANRSHAEGRKAAEKEYEAKIGLDYTISTSVKLAAFNKLENDFRDLFNIANEMAMNLDSFTDEAGNCHIKFHAWKKARWIE